MMLEPKEPEWEPADIDAVVAIFGGDCELLMLIKRCPVCDEMIVVCNNGWLDIQPGDSVHHVWSVMKLGQLFMMGAGGNGGGSKHDLHKHQPSEE